MDPNGSVCTKMFHLPDERCELPRRRAIAYNAVLGAAVPPATTATANATQTSSTPSFAAIVRSPRQEALQLPPSIAPTQPAPPLVPSSPLSTSGSEKYEDARMDVEGPPSPSSLPRDPARHELDLLRDAGATLAARREASEGCGDSRQSAQPSPPATSTVSSSGGPVNVRRCVAHHRPNCASCFVTIGGDMVDRYGPDWRGGGRPGPSVSRGKGERRSDDRYALRGKGKGDPRGRGA